MSNMNSSLHFIRTYTNVTHERKFFFWC